MFAALMVRGGIDEVAHSWINSVRSNGGFVTATSFRKVDKLIRNLKNAGVFSILDRIWLLANADNSEAQAFTSVVNSSSTFLTKTGSFTSTTNGYQSDGSTGFIDSKFNPATAGGNYTRNSASFGVYSTTSRTTSQSGMSMAVQEGATGNLSASQLLGYFTPVGGYAINHNNAQSFGGTATNANGLHLLTRTASNACSLRQYNGSGTTVNNDTTNLSQGTPNANFYICARNLVGTGAESFTTDKIALAFIGGSLTSTQADNLAAAFNAYMTSLGLNVY